MALLTAEQILSAGDSKIESVHVPEWGGEVLIRTLPQVERDRFSDSLSSVRGKPNLENFTARLLAICLVDESGELLFKPDQIAALGKKSAPAMQRCYEVATRLNRFERDEVGELTKNSDASRDGASS